MDALARKLGLDTETDQSKEKAQEKDKGKEKGKGEKGRDLSFWYQVTMAQIEANGGSGLLDKYNDSVLRLLETVYPEFRFDPLKFPKAPASYWNRLENQKRFLDELALKLGFDPVNEKERWYKVTPQVIKANGGGGLLKKYNNNLSFLLRNIYPNYVWLPFRFEKSPQRFWHSSENQKLFLENLRTHLGLSRNLEDWYQVKNLSDEIRSFGGGYLLNRIYRASPFFLFSTVFPEQRSSFLSLFTFVFPLSPSPPPPPPHPLPPPPQPPPPPLPPPHLTPYLWFLLGGSLGGSLRRSPRRCWMTRRCLRC